MPLTQATLGTGSMPRLVPSTNRGLQPTLSSLQNWRHSSLGQMRNLSLGTQPTHLQSVSFQRQQTHRHHPSSAPARQAGPGATANALGFCVAGAASGISHQEFVDSVKQSPLISVRLRRQSELSRAGAAAAAAAAASPDPFSSDIIDDFDDFIARRKPSKGAEEDPTSPLPRVFVTSPLARSKLAALSSDGHRGDLAAQRGFREKPRRRRSGKRRSLHPSLRRGLKAKSIHAELKARSKKRLEALRVCISSDEDESPPKHKPQADSGALGKKKATSKAKATMLPDLKHAAGGGVPKRVPAVSKPLRVAIWNDNVSFEDRQKHPGPQNIQQCLAGTCWTNCDCPGSCPPQKQFRGQQFVPKTKSCFVTGAMIRDGYLKSSNIDVVVFPGGSSKKQSRILSGVGQRKLMEFVRDGGGFVGICAGAYLASTRQMGLMNVEAVKPWYRGHAYVDLEMTAKGEQLLGCPGDAPASPRAAAALGKGSKVRHGRYSSTGPSRARVKRTGSIVGGPLMAVRYHNGPALAQLPRKRLASTAVAAESSSPAPPPPPPPTQSMSKNSTSSLLSTVKKSSSGLEDVPAAPSRAVAAALALPGQLARIPRENYVVLAYYNTDARRERRQQVAALSPRSAEDTRAKSTAAPSGQEPSGEESDEVQECESGSATKSAASPEAEKFIRAALDSGLATDGGSSSKRSSGGGNQTDDISSLHGFAAIAMSTYGKGILVAIGPHPESTHRHLKLSKAVGEKPFRRLVQRAVLVAAGVLT